MKLGDRVQAPVSLRELGDVFGWGTFQLGDEWPCLSALDGADLNAEDYTFGPGPSLRGEVRMRGIVLSGKDRGHVEGVECALLPNWRAPDAMASAVSCCLSDWDKPVALRDVARSLPIPLQLVRAGGAR